MIIRFKGKPVNVTLQWGTYYNHNLALAAMKDGQVYAKLSLNPPEVLNSDEICIKNYSENEGVLDSLIELGIVSKPIGYIASDNIYVGVFPVCKVLNPRRS